MSEIDKGTKLASDILPEHFDFNAVFVSRQISTRANPNPLCNCHLCQVARTTLPNLSGATTQTSRSRATTTATLCLDCKSIVGRGLSHRCNRTTLQNNLAKMCSSTDDRTKEVVAGKLLNDIKHDSNQLSLRTQGPSPLRVSLHSSQQISSSAQISTDDIYSLQRNMNCSNRTMRNYIVPFIRSKYGRKSVISNVDAHLATRDKQLKSFFLVEKIADDDVGCDNTLVYCNDVVGFISFVVADRAISSPRVKVGIDAGAGFLKFCLTIWEEDDTSSRRTANFSGVKRTFIIAISPNLKERYENVKIVLEKLQIKQLDMAYTFSVDLKLANILVGIQSHGSSYPCVYCDCPKSNFSNIAAANSYTMRTLGTIRQNAMLYQSAKQNFPNLTAKDYKSCVHKPLVSGEDRCILFQSLTPSELHLMLRVTNKLFSELEKSYPIAAANWIKQLGISRPKLHSGEFNGNMCRRILSKSHSLIPSCNSDVEVRNIGKFIDAFDTFNDVVKSCFGMTLEENFGGKIDKFAVAVQRLGVSITTSMHIVIHHVKQFCNFRKSSLGPFSEQATEAIHYDFVAMWQHGGKVSESHQDYDQRLLSSIVRYNGRHL